MWGMCRTVWAAAGAAALSTLALPAAAQTPRVEISFAHDWHFQQSDTLSGVEDPAFDDSRWSMVDVPHTWNRIGNQGTTRSPESNHVQGIGWYRLYFDAPRAVAGRPHRYFLQFDAVGNVADVWLNGHYLGKHAGAFARFRFDATSAMKLGARNILVVKADNSRPQPGSTTEAVIPLSGDFFVFGGIYRDVTLIVTDPAHVDMLDYGGPGVYAHAVSLKPEDAVVQVAARLVNDGPKPEKVSVEAQIQDAGGKVVASTSKTAAELTAKVAVMPFTLHVPQPHLWNGLKDPYLYQTVVSVRSLKGELLDQVTQPLGLRTEAFDPDKGFFLNGQHLLLHGAAMHQDRPVKGWAISRADQEQDFRYLIDMGGNAVRLAHYQHDQASYEIADARGVVVWAEIPLVNHVSFDGTPASAALTANATQQLLELIRQNYNHPSIAVWSIANEVDLRATQSKGPSQPLSLLKSLNKLAKSEDPIRFTAMADCCEVGLPPHRRTDQGSNTAPAAARDQIVGVTDVAGYNRYFGWYDGKFSDFGAFLDEAHARHPKLPLSVSEYGAGAALTQHSENPLATPISAKGRPHPEEYQELYHEAAWETLRARPYVWGVFVWNMFDFASDSRNEGDSTDINDKGMVSYDRSVAKDTFYFYRANWSTAPTLHLVGRRFTERSQAEIDVKAYSNAAKVHLWVNDHDQGEADCAGGICLWHGIHLTPGTNNVRVTAKAGVTELNDSLQWKLQ